MIQPEIEIDARQLQAAMKKAPVKVLIGLNKWVAKTTFYTENVAKQLVPPSVDTGQLLNSIKTRITNLKGEVKPTAKHAIFVHEGRRPGAAMPPYKPGTALNRWATKRGIPPFLAARSIKQKGIQPNPFMDEAYRIVKPQADRDASRTLNQIVSSI